MIHPKPSRILEILELPVQFKIPEYQRAFAWGKSEALEFMDDLKNYSTIGSGSLFLGTFIFDNSKESETKVLTVVDGQQRLTTILILLIACRTLANQLNEIEIATLIQNKITFIDQTTAESVGRRLIASESIRDLFEYVSRADWGGDFPPKIDKRSVKRQISKIKPIYDFFLGEIREFNQEALSNFLKAIYDTYVVRIDIKDELEAFSIFERTNARGIDLEASDLLKNYLFAQRVSDLDETWRRIIDNSDGTVLRMLKYYYVAQNGSVSKSELYRKIRAYADRVGAATVVQELSEFSEFYNAIRSATKEEIRVYFESLDCRVLATEQDKYESVYRALEGLRLFKISQTYPLINAALNCFVRTGGGQNKASTKKLIGFLGALEKYHFINNAVCERIGNEVEKPYAKFCVEFANSDDFEVTANSVLDALRKQLATEEEFVTRFVDISYSPDNIPLICYIFDRINNKDLDPGNVLQLFNPDPKILRKNHNIEHFYPQNPGPEIQPDSDTMAAVDNIGNLLVISFRTNSKLGNLSPAAKIAKLNGLLSKEIQNHVYVRSFVDTYGVSAETWDNNTIQGRSRDLALDAYRRVWKID